LRNLLALGQNSRCDTKDVLFRISVEVEKEDTIRFCLSDWCKLAGYKKTIFKEEWLFCFHAFLFFRFEAQMKRRENTQKQKKKRVIAR